MNDSERRKEYYQRNKEKIRAKAVEYYHKRKTEDPKFYDMILKRNNSYYHKVKPIESTPEEEEEQLKKISEWIKRVNNDKVF
jgi:hypothetical protein